MSVEPLWTGFRSAGQTWLSVALSWGNPPSRNGHSSPSRWEDRAREHASSCPCPLIPSTDRHCNGRHRPGQPGLSVDTVTIGTRLQEKSRQPPPNPCQQGTGHDRPRQTPGSPSSGPWHCSSGNRQSSCCQGRAFRPSHMIVQASEKQVRRTAGPDLLAASIRLCETFI